MYESNKQVTVSSQIVAASSSPSPVTIHKSININASNTTIDERGGVSVKSSTTRFQKLHPHANFISLRSGGSDSVYNNSWIKHGRSYDIDNSDNSNSNDIFSSCSLQQSQTLLQLPAQPPHMSVVSFQNNRSSSPLTAATTITATATVATNSVAASSFPKRAINPISSLRRHMFVNSRRNAQTTIDYNTNYEDSMNKDLSNENFVTIETNNDTMIELAARDASLLLGDLTPSPTRQAFDAQNQSWVILVSIILF